MHKRKFCQKLFEKSLSNSTHKKRIDCLSKFVSSVLSNDTNLSVKEIGCSLPNTTSLKHKIKSADAFIGNEGFVEDIPQISKGLANFFWSHFKELIVLVDWTGACSDKMHVLQASVVGHGRSIPLYMETYTSTEQETKLAHEKFLDNLNHVIPDGCKVTIITDAGFHRDWFLKVASFGWDFIGRIYSRYSYLPSGSDTWHNVSDIKINNINKPEFIGEIELGKTKHSLRGYLYTYKAKPSGKEHKKNKFPSHEKAFSKSYRNSWVIFSSLNKSANTLIKFYKKRMQIEQNFRDIKNERYGIGLRRNNSKGLVRITMLYFLGMLASILLWWIGLMTEIKGEHRKYQANTVKNMRVISLMKLGRLVISESGGYLSWPSFISAIKLMVASYFSFIDFGTVKCVK